MDATALSRAIAAGSTTARDVMAATLDACAASDLGAVARVLPRDAALALSDVPPSGPFAGLPVLAKDLGSAARGLAPGAGSDAVRKRGVDPAADSNFFSRLRAAGAVPFGLSTVPELGFSLSSDPARNPFDPTRTPGGSSGGAAAAVASGLVALAHATDAAGSIRVPASFCGLWGLKASRGALVAGPDFGNHLMGLAGDGVIARSLRDVTSAFQATRSGQPAAELSPTPAIGLALPDRASKPVRDATRTVADAFADSGLRVIPVDAPDALGADAHRLAGQILCAAQAEWMDALGIGPDELSPLISASVARGRAMRGAEIFALTRGMAALSHGALALFEQCDVLLMPVVSGPPPRVGHFDFGSSDLDGHLASMEAIAPNAAIANACGLPSLALPAGMVDGLPVGVQIMGPPGTDAAILSLAARIADRLPPIRFPAPITGMPA